MRLEWPRLWFGLLSLSRALHTRVRSPAAVARKVLELKATYDKTRGAEADALLVPLASAFVASYRTESAASVESSFGPTQLVCLDWCRLMRDLIKDIWDEGAEPARNASRCIALLSNGMDAHPGVADVLEALLLCARVDANVPSFVESGLCPVLGHFLEACLECMDNVMQGPVASTVLAVFNHLLALPTMCDALAGSPTLFLLLTLPVREANVANAATFGVACAMMAAVSVPHWGRAVLTSLHDSNWLGFVLSRLNEEASTMAPQCVVRMAAVIVEALRQVRVAASVCGCECAVLAQRFSLKQTTRASRTTMESCWTTSFGSMAMRDLLRC